MSVFNWFWHFVVLLSFFISISVFPATFTPAQCQPPSSKNVTKDLGFLNSLINIHELMWSTYNNYIMSGKYLTGFDTFRHLNEQIGSRQI